nr:cation-transporting P-type ATPase [Kutzneria sp. 744]
MPVGPWYARTAEEAVASLGADPSCGLSAARAEELLRANGPNALPEEKPRPGWLRSSRSTAATCRSFWSSPRWSRWR